MASLPTLSGREVVNIFVNDGWQMVRQRGSHMILVKAGRWRRSPFPITKKSPEGTLRSLIRSSGLTSDECSQTSQSCQKLGSLYCNRLIC
jgi:predicted RNA binding protein YcfA (HicA-like mRNA interferase family)